MVLLPYKLNDNYLNISTPRNAAIQYMGIHNVKDIDVALNVNTSVHYDSATEVTIKKGETIFIDGSDIRMKPFIIYNILEGSLPNIPIGNNVQFMILDKTIYYTIGDSVNQIKLISYELTLGQDITIQLADYGNVKKYSFDVGYPTQKIENFYTDKGNKALSRFSIPVVPSVNMNWSSSGLYYDGIDTLNALDVNNVNYQTMNDRGFFTNNGYVPGQNITGNQYILNNITDLIV